MLDRIENIFQVVTHAITLIANDAVSVNPLWLLAGIVLHYTHQVVRIRGWWHILRVSYPDAETLRYRDVVAAYFAGSGLNAVVPARGGDVMKLYMVKQRIPDGHYPTLVGSFVPEGLFETACGLGLLIWALARGFIPVPTSRLELPTLDVTFVIRHPILSAIIVASLIAIVVFLIPWLRRNADSFMERLKLGLVVLRRPLDYLEHVVSWQPPAASSASAPWPASWRRSRCRSR